MSVVTCARARCNSTEVQGWSVAELHPLPLCRSCQEDFSRDPEIDRAARRKLKASRRYEVRLRFVAGGSATWPAVLDADAAGDELEEATTELRRVVDNWLKTPRPEARPS